MRHAISWSDLVDARVGVWGMGMEGRANLRRLEDLGLQPVLVDDQPVEGSVLAGSVLATGAGGLAALAACDVVVKTPGISRYRPDVVELEAAGVAVVGGLGLWLHGVDRRRVVCVTGTKGKSTTTTILGHLLRGLGHDPFVGGNIGLPPYAPEVRDDHDVWVIETSSYQATDLADAPGVVCITSLHPDHLPWHRDDPETYFRDKLSLCTLPGPHVTVANGDDQTVRDHTALLGEDVRWVTAPARRPAWLDALGLLGAHNDRNALMATACLDALGVGADDVALAEAAADMPKLDSRLQPVATVADVLFVDDSLSTNVLPTVAAVEAFDGRAVALLVGGQDRGIDYQPLGAFLRDRSAPTLLLAMPSNGDRVLTEVALEVGGDGFLVTRSVGDLAEAVAAGFDWARGQEGVVLLSPAAPSFDLFRDYRHRAEVFTAAAEACRA